MKKLLYSTTLLLLLLHPFFQGYSHEITFCGEKIPVTKDFVSKKLMNIIRQQVPYVNMVELRRNANQYFKIVEAYLKATGLPEDFKYLAIVESGFTQAVSPKGATGFWQFMAPTAKEYGLTVNESIDERNDIYKSTYAACRQLADYYNSIAREFKVYSWVLTAAAYNFGIGNMGKEIRRQGGDYFQMKLNEETASYVYKIIAVKELWEYPELYMKDFGYNLFSSKAADLNKAPANDELADATDFSTMIVNVDVAKGNYPKELQAKEVSKKELNETKTKVPEKATVVRFIQAKITGKHKNFQEGGIISFSLVSDLQVGNKFTGRENVIQGSGWFIDNRIFVDLGYDHNVVVYDGQDGQKGLIPSSLKKNVKVLLKVQNVVN